MLWVLASLTGLVAVLTLLPLWPYEAWWVRGLDFPRLQLAAFASILLVAEVLALDGPQALSWSLIAVTLACLAYQAWWILPYTPLYPQEVRSASGADPENSLCILAVNVLTPNRQAKALLDLVHENRPDVLIAVETDPWWQDRLDVLAPEYPHALKCPLDNLYGMHLYSRFPLKDAKVQFLVQEDIPSMHAVVLLPSGRRVRLHCLHPMPPSPTENLESSERDAELIIVGKSVAEANLPVIVTGDLNDVAWSATTRLFRKISGLLDPRVGRGMYNTFHAHYPFLRWPLDHLFHSDHFTLMRIERLGPVGSDHFPILVQLRLEPERNASDAGLTADSEDRERADQKTRAENVSKDDVHTPGE